VYGLVLNVCKLGYSLFEYNSLLLVLSFGLLQLSGD